MKKVGMDSYVPVGHTPYSYSFESHSYNCCRWYQYPLYRIVEKLKWYRSRIYRWLNRKGIMRTPEGCYMRLSDIWNK